MLGRTGEGEVPEGGYWYTFERGKRRGETFDLGLKVCTNPLCWCTNLDLECTHRDSPEGGTTALHVTLDVFARKFRKHRSGDRAARSLGRALARDLADEDWATLRQVFLSSKTRLTKEADLARLDDSDFPHDEIEDESLLVGYRDIVPFDEHLQVEAGGELFLIDDLYCMQRHCRCQEVHLVFVPIPRKIPTYRFRVEDPALETCVILDLGSGQWKVVEQGRLAIDGEAMMRAFFDRHHPRAMAVFKERRRVLRAMYRNYLRRIGHVPAPSVARVKAGRNDPCPCGSGKKFKKCCLPNAVGQ